MAELWLHETSVADCTRFEQFHALDWNPRLFGWTSFQNPSRLWADYMRLRLSPADAKIVDAAAARPFGPATWPLFNCSNGLQCWRDPADGNATQSLTLRAESVLMATNLDILQRSTGLDLRSLSLLVEFGGGTGQLALVAKAAGMRDALHVVYDLTPMGLSQRYWLRRAGLGAYMVPSEWPYSLLAGVGSGAPGSSLAAGRVALVSSTSPEVNQELLPRLLRGVGDSAGVDAAAGGGSLFVATWSFSESSLSAREAIRPLLGSFDRLLIRFRDSFDKLDNRGYLRALVTNDLARTHSVCVWNRMVLAVRSSSGGARCLTQLGCTAASVDGSLRSRGVLACVAPNGTVLLK